MIRLLDTIFAYWFSNEFADVFDVFTYWYGTILYILMVSIVWINKNNLQNLNIDKSFVGILIIAGLVLSFFYVPPSWGIFVGLASLFLCSALRNKQFNFGKAISQNWGKNAIFIASGFLPILVNYFLQTKIVINSQSIFQALDVANLHGVVFEELLFRGMFWAYLLNLGISERKIIFVQALFFWIVHFQYFNRFWTFWFAIPVVSLVFGILVKRTKSLTQSTVSHFLYNFCVGVVGYSS